MCDALHAATSSGVPVDHHLAAGVPALRPEVDHVVGRLDHVEVVLDQQHRVAGVHQPVQRLEQPLDVREVQAGRRLVEDVDGVLRALQLAQLRRDLDPLRLAAGQRRRRLAERQVAEAEIVRAPRSSCRPPARPAKNVTPSSTDMFSTSSIVLPRSVTSSVSLLKRAPLHAPQVTSTSGMK